MSRQSAKLRKMRPHLVIMSALFLGAAVVGYLLLPGENERVAMLERDGNNQAALALLEQRFNKGDRRQRTLFQLQRLYNHFGDLAKSRLMLELLSERRPRDVYVQRQLAQFYKVTQDEDAYVAALRRQLSIRYSNPACRELIGILRRSGAYEQEQKTLEDCRVAGYRRPDDLVRLAFLNAVDGNMNKTAELMASIDDRRKLRSDRERMMLFEALLVTNDAEEAYRRGVRWLKGAPDDHLALTLIARLTRAQRFDIAIRLASNVSRPGDSVSLTVAELMLEQDQIVAARSYLRGWLEKTKFDAAGTVNRFVLAALDADDVELALAGGERAGLKTLAQDDLAILAEAMSASGNVEQFKRLVAMLRPETLKGDPLLGAAIAQSKGQFSEAKQLLAAIKPAELDEWRQTLWRRLDAETSAADAKARKLSAAKEKAATRRRGARASKNRRRKKRSRRVRPN